MTPKKALGMLLAFVMLSTVGGIVSAGFLLPVAAGVGATRQTVSETFESMPDDFTTGALSEQSVIYANDKKTVLGTFYTQNRIVVKLDEISTPMQQAVVAREDKRFFSHSGVDPQGLIRAAVSTLSGSETQGASTLTQQYVKNALIDQAIQDDDPIAAYKAQEVTIARKLREAKLAIGLEEKMSKSEILEAYLNIAPFGKNVYGVETAARHYFSVNAKDLTPIQAATIAAITKSPNSYDPTVNPDEAQKQRNTVLQLMYQEGYISKAERDKDIKTPIAQTLKIRNVPVGCQTAKGAAFFCDYVVRTIESNSTFGETQEDRRKLLFEGGLKIYTTLDPKAQAAAEKQVTSAIPATDPSGLETAMTSVEPGTGKITAMAQNTGYDATGSTSAPGTTAVNYSVGLDSGGSRGFSPGSTFKVFTLASWLKTGHSLNQTIPTGPRTYHTSDFACASPSKPWSPTNAENAVYSSQTPLRATELSTNTAFVYMGSQVGLCNMTQMAKDTGFRAADGTSANGDGDPTKGALNPSMIIGSVNADPLNMASAYATFASGGTQCEAIAINEIVNSRGDKLDVPSANCKKTVDAGVASAVTYALRHVLSDGLAKGYSLEGRDAAIKTGTAQDTFHLWAVGYTPQLSTAVWVGNAEGDKSLYNTTINGRFKKVWYGIDLPVPMWQKYMNTALQGAPQKAFAEPPAKFLGDKAWNGN